jgi:hypothetical protein
MAESIPGLLESLKIPTVSGNSLHHAARKTKRDREYNGTSIIKVIINILLSNDRAPCLTKLKAGSITVSCKHCTAGNRARIFKLLKSPRIKEWIPPAYLAWRAGTTTLFLLGS